MFKAIYYPNTGEVIGLWNCENGPCPYEDTVDLSMNEYAEVCKAAHLFEVRNGRVIRKATKPAVTVKAKAKNVAAGVMFDGNCYSLSTDALAVLLLGLASGAPMCTAVVHTKTGDAKVSLEREKAQQVAERLSESLADILCS